MRKNFIKLTLLASMLFTFHACSAQATANNQEVTTTDDGKILLGYQTKDQLLKAPYNEWYTPEFTEYAVDKKSMDELKEKLSSYTMVVALGTWCEDSHRHVPRLMKILETADFPEANLSIIAFNRNKVAPGGEEKKYNIELVPTIIVQKGGKEIGRIVEHPTTGYLERDLLEILRKDQ